MRKLLYLLLLLLGYCPLLLSQDQETEGSMDKYYALKEFGEHVFIDEENGVKSYVYYVGEMRDKQYSYFLYLLKLNSPFVVKETWSKQFVHIEFTAQSRSLVQSKMRAAKNEMERLWRSSSNPVAELERIMR